MSRERERLKERQIGREARTGRGIEIEKYREREVDKNREGERDVEK